MCAGTVVEPPGPTSAAIVSVISRSRSVALKLSLERSALISTLARIGIVFRRSTTRWTWPSDFRSCARSTVTFMLKLARSRGDGLGDSKRGVCGRFPQEFCDRPKLLIQRQSTTSHGREPGRSWTMALPGDGPPGRDPGLEPAPRRERAKTQGNRVDGT